MPELRDHPEGGAHGAPAAAAAPGGGPSLPRDPFRSLLALQRRQGEVARYRAGSEDAYLISSPGYIRHVLVENSANYSKETPINSLFKAGVADGLLTSEGDIWRRHRRIMQPAFRRERIVPLAGSMVMATLEMLDRWRASADRSTPLDIAAEMGSLTLRITTKALFGLDLEDDAIPLGDEIARGMKNIVSPHKADLVRGRAHLHALIAEIIERRRRERVEPRDLLSLLLEARDPETARPMAPDQLRDEMMTLLLAGHETTANTLTWTLYLLSQYPEVARRLRLELDEVVGEQLPTAHDLAALPFTYSVVQESLRLYPPAWIIGRRAVSSDRLGDHRIPAGSVLAMCPYTMHRDPRFWDDPEQFRPTRFLSNSTRPFVYFPFGAGPRVCIGQHFAMIEAQLIVATVARRFDLQLPPQHSVVPERLFVLRPRGGLPMYLDHVPSAAGAPT